MQTEIPDKPTGESVYLPAWIRLYRIIFGGLAIYAVYDKRQERAADEHFYQFFANQSGIIAAIILLLGGTMLAQRIPPVWWSYIRGAGVMIAILTGLVFAFVLEGLYNPFTDHGHPWSDTMFHQVLPMIMVLDLCIHPLDHRVSWWGLVVFPSYPLTYLGYCLWIGRSTGWYPYVFMDPSRIGKYLPFEGWTGVVFANVILLAGFITLSVAVIALSRLLCRRRGFSRGCHVRQLTPTQMS